MRFLFLVSVFLLVACGAPLQEPIPSLEEIEKLEQTVDTSLPLVQQAYSIETEKVCLREGGEWKKVGRQQADACVLPASDAGKACQNSAECEVACVVQNTHAEAGEVAPGVCLESTNLFGCRAYISKGIVEPTLCVD